MNRMEFVENDDCSVDVFLNGKRIGHQSKDMIGVGFDVVDIHSNEIIDPDWDDDNLFEDRRMLNDAWMFASRFF